MLKHVILALNPLEPESWTTHDVEDVCAFLAEQFVEWPSTARIYNAHVSTVTDVTPHSKEEIARLQTLDGPFYVVVYPAIPIAAWAIYAIIAVVVIAAIVIANQQIPNSGLRNTQSQSPNNELSERTNKPRPNGRIPDIFGTVRSTPDLISVPYKIFVENQEVEHAYMCIGRGVYEVSDIRDDTTLSSAIAGTSVEVYAPFTSPNSGDAPQLSVGNPIATPVLSVSRSNAVNGQVLRAPNDQTVVGRNNIRFKTPNIIERDFAFFDEGINTDFTDNFEVGDAITITNAKQESGESGAITEIFADPTGFFKFVIPSSTLPAEFVVGQKIGLVNALFNVYDEDLFVITTYDLTGEYEVASVTATLEGAVNYCNVGLVSAATVNPQWANADVEAPASVVVRTTDASYLFDLDGDYEIATVSPYEITLVSPTGINSDWVVITTTEYISPTITTQKNKWIGPFVLATKDLDRVFANFVATNGLYKDDGKNQEGISTTVQVEITPINADGTTRGAAELFTATITGSNKLRTLCAATLKANVTFVGRCKVRARRLTDKDYKFEGSVVDEIKWRDLYAVSPVTELDFGNITTVQSVTYATEGALNIKERKLNMLATRMIPLRISGTTFTEELFATNQADDIISAICLDPRIGNRNIAELDLDSIYDAMAQVRSYFGSDLAAEFCYTFDSANMSFEETISSVANSVFATAYRRGNIIKLSFEKETEDSTLLFNHRNKLPGTEVRTVRFGNQDDIDGVSFQYVDPEDDAVVTYYIPEDKTAVNPKEIESIGVRSKLKAHFHAWRAWNKIQYQSVITEFTATHEADLLVRNDRILIADNTRPDTQDGEVESQGFLQLKLSQEVVMLDSIEYSIFLQHTDGTVEMIPVTQGESKRHVVLSYAPRLPLALSDDLYARTTFVLVGNSETREDTFMLTEKTAQGNFTSTVRAVNYDDRYYASDKDFVEGIVDENGDYT